MPKANIHLVAFQPSQHGVFCLGSTPIADLTEAMSQSLLASVQAISDFEIQFMSPTLWRVDAFEFEVKTTKLKKVLNKEIRDFMPTGKDAGALKRWMTEVQMLFYGHNVNEARESQGLMPVSGVWVERKGLFG